MLNAALDLLLPATCAACDSSVGAPGQLCATCFSTLNFVTAPFCVACSRPFAVQGETVCLTCQAVPPPWREARAALVYDKASKGLILAFKNADRTEIASTLALHMQRAGAALLARADLLVPVPLHRWRLLARRYNQSALLAAALAKRTGRRALPDALRRVRVTQSLGRLPAAERAALLMGAIAVRPNRAAAVAGRRILLIDDVLTSGATARACTHALLDAGAASIDVLVASRVADPRPESAPGHGSETGSDDEDS